MMHQCLKSFDENGDFRGVDNPNVPRFSGCFMGYRAGRPSTPWLYCVQCCMCHPVTGVCERPKPTFLAENAARPARIHLPGWS